MRLLVCGGRDFLDYQYLSYVLDRIFWDSSAEEEDVIIQGGAIGADFLAKVYAFESGSIPSIEYPANWKRYGWDAGNIRNTEMLEDGDPDLVVAFPGGVGTANMVMQTKKAGIRLIEA